MALAEYVNALFTRLEIENIISSPTVLNHKPERIISTVEIESLLAQHTHTHGLHRPILVLFAKSCSHWIDCFLWVSLCTRRERARSLCCRMESTVLVNYIWFSHLQFTYSTIIIKKIVKYTKKATATENKTPAKSTRIDLVWRFSWRCVPLFLFKWFTSRCVALFICDIFECDTAI